MAAGPRLVLGLVGELSRVQHVAGVAGDHGLGHIDGHGHVLGVGSLRWWRAGFKVIFGSIFIFQIST